MLVVTSSRPDIANLLGLDVLDREWLARESRSRQLEDGQRDLVVGEEGYRHAGDRGDQRRQAQTQGAAFVVCAGGCSPGQVTDQAAQEGEPEDSRVHDDGRGGLRRGGENDRAAGYGDL